MHTHQTLKRKVLPGALRVLLYWAAVLMFNDHERACRWTGQPYPLVWISSRTGDLGPMQW